MAKITCKFSGVEFSCEHMPISLSHREACHPIFSLPKKRLLSLTSQWASNRLSPTESYLLYLSLFHTTDLIEWRTPAIYTPRTASIIAQNMESLIHVIGRIDLISHPSFTLPHFIISHDTADLNNTHYWIKIWRENFDEWYNDYHSSLIREETKERLSKRTHSLERMIKSPHASKQSLAESLANWAEIAASFPQMRISHPLTKQPSTLAEYYKQIIRACATDDAIWRIPEKHILEVIEHCEDELFIEDRTSNEYTGAGSIYCHSLMKLLREGLEKRETYLGFASYDITPIASTKGTAFQILPSSSSKLDAAVANIVNAAPKEMPEQKNYPNVFAYLKAKSAWELAQSQRNSQTGA